MNITEIELVSNINLGTLTMAHTTQILKLLSKFIFEMELKIYSDHNILKEVSTLANIYHNSEYSG